MVGLIMSMICEHAELWMGLCVDCGMKADEVSDFVRAGFLSSDSAFKVKRARVAELEAAEIEQLIKQRKGIMVLDLDHTLIHVSVKLFNDPKYPIVALSKIIGNKQQVEDDKVYWFTMDSGNGNLSFGGGGVAGASEEEISGTSLTDIPPTESLVFYLKARPGFRKFLHEANERFKLFVYTHGTLEYASLVISALDPLGALFGSPPRVIARADHGRPEPKSIERMFPTESKLVVVIDDRVDVWMDAEDHLIKVAPYIFFQDTDRQRLGVEGEFRRFKSTENVFDDHDMQLSLIAPILSGLVVRTFAEESAADLRLHLREMRNDVLKGMKIATTGIVPMDSEDPWSHPVIALIRELGGIDALEDDIEILIAGNPETRKAKEAEKAGIPIVHPWWLMAAQAIWDIPDPKLFTHEKVSNVQSFWELLKSEETESELAPDDLLDDLLS